MKKYEPINAQCFVKREYTPLFSSGENTPRLLYISHIRSDISDKYPRMMHAHPNFAELILIYHGAGHFLIRKKKYHVRKGDLLVYNANTVHDERPVPGSELAFYAIAIGGLQLPGLSPNALTVENAGCRFATGRHFYDLLSLCQSIHRNLSEDEPDAERFSNSLLQALIGKALSIVEERQGQRRQDDTEAFQTPGMLSYHVMQYIDNNYMNPITNQDIASALHASVYYVSHIFKAETGYSPIQYLLRRRIGEAQTLLITTDIPIVDISGMVGYDTQSYFTSQFTKFVGMPPNQYRQKYIVDNSSRRENNDKDDVSE